MTDQRRVIEELRRVNSELAAQIEQNAKLDNDRKASELAKERLMDALAASEERFRKLTNNLPGVVYQRVSDASGAFKDIYISAGATKLLGVDPDAMIQEGRSLLDYIHPEDRERKLSALADAAARNQTLVIEVRKLAQPGGDVRWWEVHTTPTPLGNGNVQWDGIAIDITDRKAAQKQLQRAQKMEAIGQLTGGVAHDFNNLLTVILGNAEHLVEQLSDNQRLRVLAELTQTAAERGAELTSRLLAFARRQSLDPKTVDLNRLLANLGELLSRALGEQIEIEFVRSAGLWLATVDPVQLDSAILNLAINARDAMPNGGRLTIETANAHLDDRYAAEHEEVLPGQYAMIAVSDTGTGMTTEVLTRAFEPFFSTKEIGRGSGLGLSMVFGFVKQSGGHIKIYSEVSAGTTVKIYLPRANIRAVVHDDNENDPARDAKGSETILIVEDNDMVRQHAERLLRELGYDVLSARNGPTALSIIQSDRRIDLLFTDVVMPGGLNGKDLADTALLLRPTLKVLFTSGYTENAVVHHGRIDQGVRLLRKPYLRRDLASKVRDALDQTA